MAEGADREGRQGGADVAAAAVLLRDKRTQEARVGQGSHELLGIAIRLKGAPVGAVESLDHLAHAAAKIAIVVALKKIHRMFVSFIKSMCRRDA